MEALSYIYPVPRTSLVKGTPVVRCNPHPRNPRRRLGRRRYQYENEKPIESLILNLMTPDWIIQYRLSSAKHKDRGPRDSVSQIWLNLPGCTGDHKVRNGLLPRWLGHIERGACCQCLARTKHRFGQTGDL